MSVNWSPSAQFVSHILRMLLSSPQSGPRSTQLIVPLCISVMRKYQKESQHAHTHAHTHAHPSLARMSKYTARTMHTRVSELHSLAVRSGAQLLRSMVYYDFEDGVVLFEMYKAFQLPLAEEVNHFCVCLCSCMCVHVFIVGMYV